MSEWMLIDSAPKELTWILLWWSDDLDGINPIYHVTHWQHLPAPPEAS